MTVFALQVADAAPRETSMRCSRLSPRPGASPRMMPSRGLMLLLKMVASGSMTLAVSTGFGLSDAVNPGVRHRQVVAFGDDAGCGRPPADGDRSSAAPASGPTLVRRRPSPRRTAPPRACERETWNIPLDARLKARYCSRQCPGCSRTSRGPPEGGHDIEIENALRPGGERGRNARAGPQGRRRHERTK